MGNNQILKRELSGQRSYWRYMKMRWTKYGSEPENQKKDPLLGSKHIYCLQLSFHHDDIGSYNARMRMITHRSKVHTDGIQDEAKRFWPISSM